MNQTETIFEETLASHCAPVLLGIKSANLVSFSKDRHPGLSSQLRRYSRALRAGGLAFEILCECEKRALVFVYRKALLNSELSQPAVMDFLHSIGYPHTDLPDWSDSALRHLKTRIASSGGFPHEIGLFLGYPPADVFGFIENKGKDFLFSGYWKVYSDAEQRKQTFAEYTACRDFLCERIAKGERLLRLLSASSAAA